VPKNPESDPKVKRSRRPPARTPDERENQLILAAHDLAERQIRAGTASSQVVTHFLKLGSSRERLEQERIKHENELLEVKKEALESAQRVEELYTEALNAMRAYAGQEPLDSGDDYQD
jgi:DNA-binding ferritin-like protein